MPGSPDVAVSNVRIQQPKTPLTISSPGTHFGVFLHAPAVLQVWAYDRSVAIHLTQQAEGPAGAKRGAVALFLWKSLSGDLRNRFPPFIFIEDRLRLPGVSIRYGVAGHGYRLLRTDC